MFVNISVFSPPYVLRGTVFIVMALSLLVIFANLSASYGATPAERYVSQVGNGVIAAANSGSVGQFRSILRRHADLRTIAKFALGRYARKVPPEQRGRFHLVVEDVITNAFATYSARLRGNGVRVVSSTQTGKHGLVVTTKIVGGSGMEIKWRIAQAGGGFRVMDLNVAGIWLSQRLRSMVANRIKRSNNDFVAALNTLK